MPFHYTLSETERTVYITAEEPADLYQAVEALSEAISDENHDPAFKLLADLKRASFFPSAAELSKLGTLLIDFLPRLQARIAVVVDEPLLYMARLASIAAKSRGAEVEVFAERDQARTWLGSCDAEGRLRAASNA